MKNNEFFYKGILAVITLGSIYRIALALIKLLILSFNINVIMIPILIGLFDLLIFYIFLFKQNLFNFKIKIVHIIILVILNFVYPFLIKLIGFMNVVAFVNYMDEYRWVDGLSLIILVIGLIIISFIKYRSCEKNKIKEE